MKKALKNTAIGITATIGMIGGTDAAVLNEELLKQDLVVAQERVEMRQVGNEVMVDMAWKGESGLRIKHDLGTPSLTERLADKRDRSIVTETVDFGDGGFKVDFILEKRPVSNEFCYILEGHESYDFWYQGEISDAVAEQYRRGDDDTRTLEEIKRSIRPSDMVGSYAVYHKDLKNNQYQTGKVMHIPRPEVWEVNNKENTRAWADMSFDDRTGNLCVTVDEKYLANAVYPVRVDPTFGYTSTGGSRGEVSDFGSPINRIDLNEIVLTESTDIDQFFAYQAGVPDSTGATTSVDITVAIYDEVTEERLMYANATSTLAPAWVEFSTSTPVSIPAQTAQISFGSNSYSEFIPPFSELYYGTYLYFDSTGAGEYQRIGSFGCDGDGSSSNPPNRRAPTDITNCNFYSSSTIQLSLYANTVEANPDWYNTDWSSRFKIEVPPGTVDDNLTDFPVYFDLADAPAGAVDDMISGCGDIRVTTDDGSTEVAREVVWCDAVSDTGELHFKAPVLQTLATSTFYVYYGNSAVSDYAVSATYGRDNVWTNGFIAVYHLHEEGSTVAFVDSTGNGNDTIGKNLETADTEITGKIGFGLNSDALSNEGVEIADSTDFDWTVGGISGWINTDTLAADGTMASRGDGGTAEMLVWYDAGTGDITCAASIGGTFQNGSTGGTYTTRSADTWYHAFCNWDGTNITNYVNGVQNWQIADTGSIDNDAVNAGINVQPDDTRDLDGQTDEIRFHEVARTEAWADAEYLNSNNASDLYSVGSAESVPVSNAEGAQTFINNGSWSIDNGTIIID